MTPMKNPILLIEDDAELSAELQESLTRRGYEIKACDTIAGAEAALSEINPRVVVSDICLPDGDGARFCMEQKPTHPNVPWLLMSGNQELVRSTKSRDERADVAIVDKPVRLRFLLDFIKQGLGEPPKTEPKN
jgi:DNA-binding NtrC family response regulator